VQSYKSPFKSLGVAGAAAAVITGLAQLTGYVVEPADAKELGELFAGSITIVAGVVALVGRLRASAKLRLGG
jgi:hypothetical protein